MTFAKNHWSFSPGVLKKSSKLLVVFNGENMGHSNLETPKNVLMMFSIWEVTLMWRNPILIRVLSAEKNTSTRHYATLFHIATPVQPRYNNPVMQLNIWL